MRAREWLAIAACTVVIVLLTLNIIMVLIPQDTSEYYTQKVSFHLPSHCHYLYGKGGDAWINCMGVGRR